MAGQANSRPYLKNLQIFRCPSDSGPTNGYPWLGGWSGPAISFTANSLMGGPGLMDNVCVGVICSSSDDWVNAGWFPSSNRDGMAQAALTQPASTVALSELHSTDVQKIAGMSWLGANSSNLWPMAALLWDKGQDYYDWAGSVIPDGARPNAPYPLGKNGGVSARHSEMANFMFADGHAKSLRPSATNPDPVNRPQENLWNGRR